MGEPDLEGWEALRIRVKLQDRGRTLHQVPVRGTEGRPEFLASRQTRGSVCGRLSRSLLSAKPRAQLTCLL